MNQNDPVHDLNLSKEELLGSRLQKWNLLAKGRTSVFRKRNQKLKFSLLGWSDL
jgi:hypothetical protein